MATETSFGLLSMLIYHSLYSIVGGRIVRKTRATSLTVFR